MKSKVLKEYQLFGVGSGNKLTGLESVTVETKKKADIAGSEGVKWLMSLQFLELAKLDHFFVKEYPYDTELTVVRNFYSYNKVFEWVKGIVITTEYLREKGYKVPSFIRFFDSKEENKLYLVSSDMTEGGKYKVWGMSDTMTKKQMRELYEMKITGNDVKKINVLLQKLINQTVKDELLLQWANIHLRFDPKTREFEIILLDFTQSILNWSKKSRFEIRQTNEESARFFLRGLIGDVKMKIV